MVLQILTWLMAIPLLGFIAGMRTMTPMAGICWFAWAGQLPVADSWAWWCAKLPVAIAFTILAILEYVADKRSFLHNPMHPGVLIIRYFFGGLAGAIVASGLNASGVEGVVLGVLGAVAGAVCSYQLYQQAVRRINLAPWRLEIPPWYVAFAGDLFAIIGTIISLGIITG